MTPLEQALRGITLLGFDSAPIIYYVESYPRYDTLVTEVFRRVDDGAFFGKTSVVSLAEVLVHPLASGNKVLEERFRALLLDSANFDTLPISADLADRAADLRARYNLRLGDALQLAVAIEQGCQAFLTNDLRLKHVTELRVLVLDELEP